MDARSDNCRCRPSRSSRRMVFDNSLPRFITVDGGTPSMRLRPHATPRREACRAERRSRSTAAAPLRCTRERERTQQGHGTVRAHRGTQVGWRSVAVSFNHSMSPARQILSELSIQLSHLSLGPSPRPTDFAGIVMTAQFVVHPDRTIGDIDPRLDSTPSPAVASKIQGKRSPGCRYSNGGCKRRTLCLPGLRAG